MMGHDQELNDADRALRKASEWAKSEMAPYRQAREKTYQEDCKTAELVLSEKDQLRIALSEAIGIIDALDGRDNSCDPKTDIDELRRLLMPKERGTPFTPNLPGVGSVLSGRDA